MLTFDPQMTFSELDATIVNVHAKREDMSLNSFAASGLGKSKKIPIV